MNMKKWIAAAVACSAFALSACGGQTGESKQAAAGEKVYRIATNAEFAPFESMDSSNQIQGFDIDLMNAMAKAGNFKVEYKHQPWNSLFPGLANGDVDILLSAITINDERKQTMDFTDPYFKITQVILVQKGKAIQSVEDLKNSQKVGVVTGQTGDLAVSRILGKDSPKIARFESLPLVIKELENGGLDAVVSDSAVVNNYIKNNGNKGFNMVAPRDFEVENYGMAVRKGDTETLNMLNDALKKVRESGEYEKVEKQYFAQQ
ncbi:basic amino acid ABC transporter substrate-binding protein [Neisseria dumasiana]|uniref:Basic amino acid ABC transporter substrate-binding protein n=1 Tax=Neisseria dumasiana TaxID=1931275 RepID=A0A1X3DIG1_9NEIS|nr:basic amino acid ABC transporter substrate-binding protein [Neisseria dumasiana]OSI22023.1 basic amino acid ABC transporter substrate-binding protein [Neisseria dumasiana]